MVISNSSNTSHPNQCVDDEILRMPLAVLYSVIFVLGLTGNLLALWVFLYVQSKKNSMRVLLINLALADLLLIISLPFRIQYHLQKNQWKLGPWLCQTVGHLFYMNMYISIILLGLISIDRYLNIYGNATIRHKLKSPRWSIVICVVLWTVALATMLPYVATKGQEENLCFNYRGIEPESMWKAYINILILVVFWLVFVCLTLSYGKIAQKLLRRSQERPDLPNAIHYSRVARKSFFILFLFIICFVPYHVSRGFYIKTQVTKVPCEWQNLADKFNEISLVFSALNSCLDPVMFFLLSASVRKEVRRFMKSVFSFRYSGVGETNLTTELDDKNDRRQSNVQIDSNLKRKELTSSSSD